MRPSTVLAALLILLVMPATAQDLHRVLKIGEVSGDALGPGEATALRGILSSYAIERGGFTVIDFDGRRLSLDTAQSTEGSGSGAAVPAPPADYVLAARASRIGSGIALTLDVSRATTGEKRSVSEVFADISGLVLAARRVAASLFDKAFGSSAAAQGSQASPRADASATKDADLSPRLSALAGTWDGDKGIDSVSLRPDGGGFALLESGARMLVKAVISGSFVVIAQDQPNSPDFYRPDLDLKSARIVSAAARRWRWVFSLSADGSYLRGFKESVFVKVDEKGAVSVDNDYSRDALWTRRSR
jgi:hypothetical protein